MNPPVRRPRGRPRKAVDPALAESPERSGPGGVRGNRRWRYNIQENRFIAEYVAEPNAAEAARKAAYKYPRQAGLRLLARPKIRAAIEEKMTQLLDKMNATAENIIRELALIGFANMGEFATWTANDVTLVESDRLTEAQKAAVAEVEKSEGRYGTRTKIKLHSKLEALTKLGEFRKLFKQDTPANENPSPLHLKIIINQPGGTDHRVIEMGGQDNIYSRQLTAEAEPENAVVAVAEEEPESDAPLGDE